MGNKSSHFYQANRPESGGADRKDEHEKSGLHEREKQQLIAEIGVLHAEIGVQHGVVEQHRLLVAERDGALQVIREELANGNLKIAALSAGALQSEHDAASLRGAYAEIARLQGLLDMIFASSTWKMHALLEKLRGR